MKGWISVYFLIWGIATAAQENKTYTDLLSSAVEVQLSDSLQINAAIRQNNFLDTLTVKKWFSRLLGSGNNNRLKNRGYALTGKITANEVFDVLVLLEKKKKTDSSSVQVVYLITTKKDGTYIASLEAAIEGTRKTSTYNTSSWLYSDYRIVQNSKILVNQQPYTEFIRYKINKAGRFILSPNY